MPPETWRGGGGGGGGVVHFLFASYPDCRCLLIIPCNLLINIETRLYVLSSVIDLSWRKPFIYIYMNICLYVCICMCVCMCVSSCGGTHTYPPISLYTSPNQKCCHLTFV